MLHKEPLPSKENQTAITVLERLDAFQQHRVSDDEVCELGYCNDCGIIITNKTGLSINLLGQVYCGLFGNRCDFKH